MHRDHPRAFGGQGPHSRHRLLIGLSGNRLPLNLFCQFVTSRVFNHLQATGPIGDFGYSHQFEGLSERRISNLRAPCAPCNSL